ncbi:protein CIP2A [Parasteatoda tepidariorum]|uniref:protein CIP2A n=1 Tax=Parasteatoda tepidariorum TaxID=114398 RepID=UPI001C720188|nr:protein CIP2A homolog [Parasteatoda tepidariorum]
MDAGNVVNAFVLSGNQYALHQNEDNRKQFQRHLEILVCLTAEEANLSIFENHTLSSSQCITHVVNVLLDNDYKQPLLTRALNVLLNMTQNNKLLKNLQLTYHVHSAISTFLQQYGVSIKDNLAIQCLQLLESVTYGVKIDYLENHFQSLISILFKFVLSETSQVLKISLHILANICRHNPKVQVHVCGLTNFKEIFKKLVTMINGEVPIIMLYALSILYSITPYNILGTKLWTDENLMLTFDLIMKLLTCNDYGSASTAVDLFIDLIQVPKHLQCLTKSPHLNRCLRKITKSLDKISPKQCELLLKFLNSLSGTAGIKDKLLSSLCVPCESQREQSLKIHPKLTLWSMKGKEVPAAITIASLQLIRSIVIFLVEKSIIGIEYDLKDIIVDILENICNSCENLNDECLAINQVSFDLLSFVCEKTDLRVCVAEKLNLEALEHFIKCLLRDSLLEENQHHKQVINLFFSITETLSSLIDILPDCEVFLSKLLQDNAVTNCVAFAITSNNKHQIIRSLSLLSPKNNKNSLNILCESLLSRSADSQKVSSHKSDSTVFFPSDTNQSSFKKSKYSDSAFDVLMNKIENGLQIKDLKSSEIMDLYEHKIAMLTLKEQEFQNYIAAKTQALQEADRIITQYKCRQADAEAEALRLRGMMKDYECRCETSAAKFTQEEQKRKRLEVNFDLACRKIQEMEQSVIEQREMTMSQMTRLTEQKKNVEEEKLRLFEQIASKDHEKKLLTTQLQQTEEDLRLKNKDLEELQESKEDLIRVLEETKKCAEKSKSNFEMKLLQLQSVMDAAQQNIASLEAKNESLMNEMVQKSEDFSHKIDDLTGENKQLVEQLKMRDLKIEDMNEAFRKLNESLQEKSNTIQENELLLFKLRKDFEQLENQRMKLKQDKGMLELLCKKYEASIEEKDSTIDKTVCELETLRKDFDESVCNSEKQIQHLKDELEKHKYITEMIHNITSGNKLPPKT